MELRKVKPLADRLWAKVDRRGPDDCWEWQGASNSRRQGHIITGRRGSKFITASRAAYIATFGPIADDADVCHSCDNPKCCNPNHLWIGSHKQNMLDMASKQRSPGQKLTREQVDAIRQRWQEGGITKTVLGRQYGISRVQVANIVSGAQWVWA